MPYGLTQTVAPAIEPFSVADLKIFLRVSHDDEDALLTDLIVQAREDVERFTGQQLITATWVMRLDGFPSDGSPIKLPKSPVQSATIEYIDLDGVTQTLAPAVYDVDIYRVNARIVLAYNQSWPSVRSDINSVIITYVSGYGAAAEDVPQTFKGAMRLLIGHWYENREATIVGQPAREIPLAVERLLWGERVVEFQ